MNEEEIKTGIIKTQQQLISNQEDIISIQKKIIENNEIMITEYRKIIMEITGQQEV